ncbi:GIY-YIG nuclease family protein [Plantibacter sp. YIM 135347]|uniref:GIY-YIG nuclease family protein n=1 Tax=Plantibacter sp. YIM 135347 TaxID=3423919 RepID=UPI003D35191F
MSDISLSAQRILTPNELTLADQVRTAPASPGIYGWWFKRSALEVPDASYQQRDGYQLLYVGISPSRAASSGTIRKRLMQHVTGNASQSTLRRTLGVLLTKPLGIKLGIHGGRPTFGPDGEPRITRWLYENAKVAWVVDPEPWVVEHELLAGAVLALNLDGRSDDFARGISAKRSSALAAAKAE